MDYLTGRDDTPVVLSAVPAGSFLELLHNGQRVAVTVETARTFFQQVVATYPTGPEMLMAASDYASNTWSDQSGNSNDLTPTSGQEANVSLSGGSVNFSGNGTLQSTSYRLPTSGDWTIGLRLKVTANGSGATSQNILSQHVRDSASSTGTLRLYHFDSDSKIGLRINGVGANDVLTASAQAYSATPFTLIIQRSGDVFKLIHNGAETTNTIAGFSFNPATLPFILGYRNSDPLAGGFLKVASYHRALSAAELTNLTTWLEN